MAGWNVCKDSKYIAIKLIYLWITLTKVLNFHSTALNFVLSGIQIDLKYCVIVVHIFYYLAENVQDIDHMGLLYWTEENIL